MHSNYDTSIHYMYIKEMTARSTIMHSVVLDDSKDMFNQNIFTYAYLGVDKIVHHLGMKEPQKPWYWYYEQFEGFSFAAEWCRIFLFGP